MNTVGISLWAGKVEVRMERGSFLIKNGEMKIMVVFFEFGDEQSKFNWDNLSDKPRVDFKRAYTYKTAMNMVEFKKAVEQEYHERTGRIKLPEKYKFVESDDLLECFFIR